MPKSHLTTSKSDLGLHQANEVPTIAKDNGKKGNGARNGGQGMTSKDLLGMASSEAPAVAAASNNPSGIDLSAWGKASSTVAAVAASAKKKGG